MKRQILLFSLILVFFSASAQHKTTYNNLKYDKVVMYDYNPSDKAGYIVEEDGKLTKGIKKQVQLDKSTINLLRIKLENKNSFGNGTSACFDPHLGFVYYLNGKVVAHLAICMDCNRLRSSINLDSQKQGKMGTGKYAYYIRDGMSDSFRKFLNKLLIKHKFSHQI
jgi:hypothetical protein